MNIYEHTQLIARTAIFTIVLMSMAACRMDEPVEPPATNMADSGNLPVLVVEHFEKHFGELKTESGELLPGVAVSYEAKDMDNDGKQELFLYNSYLCGSSGCTGPVYSEKSDDGKYCFVAMGHSTDFADDMVVLEPLYCRDYENGDTIHLSEMKKFIRPE